MGSTNLTKMPIPKYSKAQRIGNVISHLVGAIIAFGVLSMLITLMVIKHSFSVLDYFAISIYGIVLVGQFVVSSLYHYDKSKGEHKQIKRLLDHLTIFVLIACTYLPICVIGLKNTPQGLAILISEMLMMIFGIALNIWHMDKLPVRIITLILYVAMGWLLIVIPSAFKAIPFSTFIFILLGGIVYTIGAILYAIGHLKSQWFHFVFHILIVIGSVLQATGILYLLISK